MKTAKRSKPKFRVGQVVYCSADGYGKVEACELGDGADGQLTWFYGMTNCAHAREENELRPLTASERGPALSRRKK